jgi:hypothetical protein
VVLLMRQKVPGRRVPDYLWVTVGEAGKNVLTLSDQPLGLIVT